MKQGKWAKVDDATLNNALRASLYRRTCPTTMALGDYHLGLLAADEQTYIRNHLARCPHCQAELSRLAEFLAKGPDAAVC